jgi:AbrB family looped-hinge helix DNA binding protein
MASSRITSKGQITLPKAIRETLGVAPGDRIAFRVQEDGRVLVEPETVDLRTLRGVLRPRRRGVSVEDMAAAVRERAVRQSRT